MIAQFEDASQEDNGIRDDPEIPGDELLYRRVTLEQVRMGQANSNAFHDSTRDRTWCSIGLGSKLAEYKLTPTEMLKGYESTCGLVELTAQEARDAGMGVAWTPRDGEPAHGSLIGKKTQGTRRKLARASRLILQPPRESGAAG